MSWLPRLARVHFRPVTVKGHGIPVGELVCSCGEESALESQTPRELHSASASYSTSHTIL